tara:strand:+ start:50 stop:472 length:423 start_codon:yes stop_codon:yes gene_type:complete
MKNKLHTLLILTGVILISGCSSMGVKPLEIFTTEVERERLNLDPVSVETMANIQVIVITSKNQKEVFAKLVEEGIDPVVFGFTDLGWQQLQYNMQLNNKQIQKLRFQLEQYKKYYEGVQTKTETKSSLSSFLDNLNSDND